MNLSSNWRDGGRVPREKKDFLSCRCCACKGKRFVFGGLGGGRNYECRIFSSAVIRDNFLFPQSYATEVSFCSKHSRIYGGNKK